jgi:hypothetical protein
MVCFATAMGNVISIDLHMLTGCFALLPRDNNVFLLLRFSSDTCIISTGRAGITEAPSTMDR